MHTHHLYNEQGTEDQTLRVTVLCLPPVSGLFDTTGRAFRYVRGTTLEAVWLYPDVPLSDNDIVQGNPRACDAFQSEPSGQVT
jgi:hypothetical protein